MAFVPLSGSNIRLLSGVPFSNDYKHTRWFDSQAAQESYFLSKPVVHSILQANFQRIEGKNFIRVNKSIDDLWLTNYLMFKNERNVHWWYAFVTKLEFVQKGVTDVHFQIDVFQSWKFYMNFKPSYVVREHCKLWNTDGTPVVNTVDENLNYGTEYNIAKVQNFRPYDDLYFMVVVSKKAMHTDASNPKIDSTTKFAFSVNGLPQALNYYILPFRLDGSTPACNIPLTSLAGAFLLECYKSTDAVNNIVSIYITDMLPDQSPYDGDTLTLNNMYYDPATIGSANCVYVSNIPYGIGTYVLDTKYAGFSTVKESKLLMHPYTTTLLTDFKGNQIEIKNEYINGTSLRLDVKSSLGVSNKVSYTFKDYLTSLISDDYLKDMVNTGHSLIDNNPNDLPVLTDLLAAYIQGNRNSIKTQYDQTMFNGVMGVIGNGIGMMGSALTGNMTGASSSAAGMVQGAGNTIYSVQAMHSKIKDISNTPPSVSKLGGNAYFDYGNGLTGVWMVKKEITPEYRKKLTDFFNMYGYKVNEVKVPNFHTRQNWNFVQTLSCSITGDFNNEDLQELKSIFDNGITLWHTDDIGNYALDNGVI